MDKKNNQIPNWCKSYLSETDIHKLESVIREVEATTSGELVVVINRRCTDYKLLPFTLSLLFWIVIENSPLIDLAVGQLGHATLCKVGFILLSVLLGQTFGRFPIWHRWLASPSVRSAKAWAAAELEFYRSKIQNTKEATGILVFISLYEHQVVVLADKRISDKKPKETWNELISQILKGIKTDSLSAGLSEGLLQSGKLLKELFPANKVNENELSNSIVFRDLH
jgi:putative membrane protein